MERGRLSQQVEAYLAWKRDLIKQVTRYQTWLQANQLMTDDVEMRLKRGLQLLREDQLTLAFVGEFSRGKTELINALFFSNYGKRMLPSQAGRTTMCPTELFFDQKLERNYIRLLPIETRAQESTVADFKKIPNHWVEFPLDVTTPESMLASLAEVSRSKSVTPAEAQALGFEESMLDHDANEPGKVTIPAWRHALISLDNPLLQQGLRILDTPGLNALGSEPELTVSMLPSAHAVIFVLSADAGVTASDMAIWNDHICTADADHRAGRFAVLNKIDVLWDDIEGEGYTEKAIQKVIKTSADHLGLKTSEVLPVSAKQALVGKVRDDAELYQRSLLPSLEALLSDRILTQREHIIAEVFLNDVLGMLQNSQAILRSRLDKLSLEQQQMAHQDDSRGMVKDLSLRTQQDYDFYYKKLISLRSSRRLMASQGEILQKIVSPDRLQRHIDKTRGTLINSWTTVGMNRAINNFFNYIDYDINNLSNEVELAEKMVRSIYQRYIEESRAQHLKPPQFHIRQQVRELDNLKSKATQFRRNLRNIMSEQTIVIKRFFNTLVNEASQVYNQIRQVTEHWPNEALLPLMQYTQEQKQVLEHQIKRLRELTSQCKDELSRQGQVQKLIDDSEKQLFIVESIQRMIRKPPPTLRSRKVVSLRA